LQLGSIQQTGDARMRGRPSPRQPNPIQAFACRLGIIPLAALPFGETRSYGQIAQQIGRPDAVRAVGAANGRTPISIIAPCHRVTGSTGELTGFAGGLAAKAHLLGLEGAKAKAIRTGA
jgi:O-6-methylguanine DNA methyltransferase